MIVKYIVCVFLVAIIVGCSNHSKTKNISQKLLLKDTSFECNCSYQVESFEMDDTLLSGGYHLRYYYKFSAIDTQCLQVVDLMKGSMVIKSVNSMDYRFSHGRLGWKEVDYIDKFVFVIGILSMPNFMNVIEKETGNNLLTGFFHERIDEVILYSTFEEDNSSQELRVLDMKNNVDFEIIVFNNMNCYWEEEWFGDCMRLDSVSNANIWISIETTKGKVVEKYNR